MINNLKGDYLSEGIKEKSEKYEKMFWQDEFNDELGFIWKDYFDFNYKQCACSKEESSQRADVVLEDIKFFISNLIDQTKKDYRNELTDKLLTAFNLTVKDLPPFPHKDLDVIELIIAIGKERIIRAEREKSCL